METPAIWQLPPLHRRRKPRPRIVRAVCAWLARDDNAANLFLVAVTYYLLGQMIRGLLS